MVGKDGSIEEMGMDKIIDPEDIGEWEDKMVGANEIFGAGADSSYCIPC